MLNPEQGKALWAPLLCGEEGSLEVPDQGAQRPIKMSPASLKTAVFFALD